MTSPSYHPRFTHQGREYEVALLTELTWVEMDLLEQITGMTYEELLTDRMAQFSRVSGAMALISINRAEVEDGKPVTAWAEFRTQRMSEVKMVRTPLPEPDEPTGPTGPLTLPEAGPGVPHPDAPMYERLGEADPSQGEQDGSAPTSPTSEPSTSGSSPPSSGSDPGNGDG